MHICAYLQSTHSFLPWAHPSAPCAVPRGAVALPFAGCCGSTWGVSESLSSLQGLGEGVGMLLGPGVLLQLGNGLICVAKSDKELPFYQHQLI